LGRVLGPFEVERTRAPRDAERIAREGVRAGVERLIVAGGDGTVSEAASGVLGAELGDYVQFGVLPLGTGGDFARNLHIPKRLDQALEVLAAGKSRRIDAGRIRYRDAASNTVTGYFINVASFGISGMIDRLVNQAPKVFGGMASFLIGTLKGLARHRSEHVTLRVDGEIVHDGPLLLATAANGGYFGGGMLVAPRAELDDGWLDVVVIPDLPKWRLLAKLPLIYSGAHLDDPNVGFFRGRHIAAEAREGSILLDVDGECPGSLPAQFEVIPKALEVIGGPA
jgi:YegS/Rv2252/BmrU family lipid kinase